jgi:competence protein ComEA
LEMKRNRINSQHRGLCILIVILFLGWGIKKISSAQGDLETAIREHEIYVLITGELKNPGVYAFDREPCLEEALARAGGCTANLMVKKQDTGRLFAQGMHVHMSREEKYVTVSTGTIPGTYKVTLQIPISINTATQDDLDAIPYIGPSLARKIIEYRTKHGRFTILDEIKNVSGVGTFRYLKIRPYIGI